MFLLLVTLISTLIAAIMSAIAWRIARDERRRSEARVAALASEIHDDPRSMPAPATVDDLELRPSRAVADSGGLFAAQPPRAGSRWAAVLAGGVFVAGSAVALVILSSRGSNIGAGEAVQRAPAAAAAAQPAPARPLELVALGHERDGDRLIVRGVVRNPDNAVPPGGLAAVVFLFNRDGGFLASGRVTLDSSALKPGGESPFVVSIPGAADVGRYRVSFRTDDHVVPHVDLRAPLHARL
jgi:hypothetical protein